MLKRALISAPILAYPGFTQPFHLYVDASQTGIGIKLGQNIDKKETAVAYAGRDFNAAEECNYSAMKGEALAVIAGIKRFQLYLYERKFYVHTDHKKDGIFSLSRAWDKEKIYKSPRGNETMTSRTPVWRSNH